MSQIIHKAADRILNDLGWLCIRASFRDDAPLKHQRNFGKLVILDDALMIPGGRGFKLHPHNDMEIVSWILSGTDEHNDSQNGITLLDGGDVQLMSAGTGIEHAENNHSLTDAVHMFQIWVEPNKRNIAPRYQTKSIKNAAKANEIFTFISPSGENDSLVINQDAYFSMVTLEAGKKITYRLRNEQHGVYVFVVLGSVIVNGEALTHRDAMGIDAVSYIDVEAVQFSQVLFIEVPLETGY